MHILIVTPAPRTSRAGNRATAARWAYMLRSLGHRVEVMVTYDGRPCDLMVALHAWRSADSVQRFRQQHPGRPLILALTGTDLYRFIHSDPEPTLASMHTANRLVVLHEAAFEAVPAGLRGKLRIILQSAPPLPRTYPRAKRHFDVLVAGHLREEKDPLRSAYAVRDLPPESRLRVVHVGKAHDEAWAERARQEMTRNRRYQWRGEIPHWQVRRLMGTSRLMVLSSRMEGGANVISEALVAGLPVVASRIAGSVGLLGADYPGFYPAEDTEALHAALLRAERDPDFYADLQRACAARAPLFRPEHEVAAWKHLLEELEDPKAPANVSAAS